MKRLLKSFLYSIVLALVSLHSVALFWQNSLMLTGILIFLSLLMFLVWRSKEDVILYIVASVSGAVAESTAIAFGAWSYAIPDISGIPYWLPFLWGIAAVFIKRISFEIHDFVKDNLNSKNKKKKR
jgi:hypothetical protein